MLWQLKEEPRPALGGGLSSSAFRAVLANQNAAGF